MTLTNIISAIGNTSSIYPLILRDCGVEAPLKVYLTYQENKEDKDVAFLATRERLLDEYATSAVWLGGIPFVEAIVNKYIKSRGLNPDVSLKLFKETDCQGIDFNIKAFEEKLSRGVFSGDEAKEVRAAIADMKKVKLNKVGYEKLLSAKFIGATTIPVAMMGFVIPKLIFGLTAKTKAAQKAREEQMNKCSNKIFISPLKSDTFTSFDLKKSQNPSFTGGFSSTVAGFTTYQKMAAIDGGYALGRIATARKKNEMVDITFKMLGMMFLNFVAPKFIEKFLDGAASKALNLDVKLDPLMLADKDFISKIADKTLKLPEKNDGASLLKFIDENPKSLFTKYAAKFGKVKLLKSGVRDPRAFVDVSELAKFKNSIDEFSKKALSNASNSANSKDITAQVQKFAKKAKAVKSLNIITNVALSSFLLAYCLPKVQYVFREWYTGSKLEPGILDDDKNKKAV